MKKIRFKKKKFTRIVAAILGFVLVVGAVSFIGKKTNGFADDITLESLLQRDLNPDNLYTYDSVLDMVKETSNTGLGFTVEVKKDGSIVANGKYRGEETALLPIAKVHLEAGVYTMTTGANTNQFEYFLALSSSHQESGVVGYFDFENTVTIETEGDYYILCGVAPETEFNNNVLRPVIVKGTEAGEFYA